MIAFLLDFKWNSMATLVFFPFYSFCYINNLTYWSQTTSVLGLSRIILISEENLAKQLGILHAFYSWTTTAKSKSQKPINLTII